MKYTYPKGFKIKSLVEQLKILQKAFPHLPKLDLVDQELSSEGEGTFIIPHWKLIGKTYNEAVLKVLEKLKESRPCYDWLSGNWTEEYLRQLPIKENFWNTQEEKLLLINAQFGEKYAGASVQSVRNQVSNRKELLFGIYEVGMMLVTHPERLQSNDDLCINCSGDEYVAHGVFSGAPYFVFRAELEFGAFGVSDASDIFGSASGFVPQPLDTRSLDSFESLTLESRVKKLEDIVENIRGFLLM